MASKENNSDEIVKNDETITISEFIEQQNYLEREAREVLPWSFDQCTYSKGYIRQPVYACKTCKPANEKLENGGICYSCSMSCHYDHELVELFNKRNFRCDCGTTRLGNKPCKLEKKSHDALNEFNFYNHNFQGRFCWCKIDYDPEKEEKNMFQLPDLENFDEYICHTCTSKYTFLKLYKNSPMFIPGEYKKKLDDKSDKEEKSIVTDNDDAIDDNKPDDSDKLTCKLEKWNNAVVNVINGAGDSQCMNIYKQYNIEYILQEEETYEPPKDDDESQTSIFESGMKILNQMDRVSAIEGAIAFSKLK
ncbi:5617_t:CDS:2 [Entrophospora sp. SA101]|nr:9543_t:CDS:2 [Entrophospora sp. SA101]CAJ0888989.1 5617_t:CDS:2 [Entrophospora sp. SA101]